MITWIFVKSKGNQIFFFLNLNVRPASGLVGAFSLVGDLFKDKVSLTEKRIEPDRGGEQVHRRMADFLEKVRSCRFLTN